jgi:Arc/MetJ-type ribon-helix-helix transcriptional regulator
MEKRIIFRVPDAMHKQIMEAVKQGKAKTPSALIRAALKEFLKDS